MVCGMATLQREFNFEVGQSQGLLATKKLSGFSDDFAHQLAIDADAQGTTESKGAKGVGSSSYCGGDGAQGKVGHVHATHQALKANYSHRSTASSVSL